MNKLLIKSLSGILIFFFFNSCASLKVMKQDNGSIVAISATSTGTLQKGYGIVITLENIETQEQFTSKSLSPMSPHSIVQNISQGKYIIYQVMVPVGNIKYYNKSDNVRTFFGQIDIKPNSKYYLGNFSGERRIGRENVLTLRISDLNIPDKLIEKIEGRNTGWKEGEFLKLYPYDKEELLIY
jgi:hypothetical protein